MRWLLSTSNFVGVVEIRDGKFVQLDRLHEGSGLYTGVTWDDRSLLFVGTNGRRWGDVDLTREKLYRPGHEPLSLGTADTHQVIWCSERRALLICDTGHDRLLAWDDGGLSCVFQLPDDQPIYRPPANRHHLNSVWVDHKRDVWIMVRFAYPLHSQVWKISAAGQAAERIAVSPESHNLCWRSGQLFTVGSYEHVLDMANRRVFLPGGYPRGLAVTDSLIAVGVGARGPASARHDGHGQLVLIADGQIEHVVGIPEAGQIYTVRALDEIDWAHQGDWGPPAPI